MARMICMFLIICCMIVRTLQYANEQNPYKTLHVYHSDDDSMKKPAVFTANTQEKNDSLKRQKRDSNGSNDKKEINRNITTAVSKKLNFFVLNFCSDKSSFTRNVVFFVENVYFHTFRLFIVL